MASIIRAPWSLHLLSPSHCSACLTTTGRPVMLWATLDHGVQLSKYDHPQLVIQAASKGGYIRPFSSQGDTFCCRESGCAGGSMASKRSLQRFHRVASHGVSLRPIGTFDIYILHRLPQLRYLIGGHVLHAAFQLTRDTSRPRMVLNAFRYTPSPKRTPLQVSRSH
jgi:hypothetical protein